ncbi:MAG: hypothetical protein KJO61_12835 [Deltaproteobacteria bacterium]|nr:hypothetical protein [Deltaproteobacteria bacterium]
MKDIGYKDVETYVRVMISEDIDSQARDKKDSATKRNKDAHTMPYSTAMQTNRSKQKEK